MTNAKHTPGPWRVESLNAVKIRDGNGDYVCLLGRFSEKTNTEIPIEVVAANARLIAATPDLLEAAENVRVEEFNANISDDAPFANHPNFFKALQQLEKAALKARGKNDRS